MKTVIKTTLKGSENTTVKENVKQVYDELIKKPSFILLTRISHNGEESKIILRKSIVKMVKEK